jgi:hypothetical protein
MTINDYVTQKDHFLLTILHFNKRLVLLESSGRGPCAEFLAVVPGQVLKCICTHLDYKAPPPKKKPGKKQHSNITK